MALTYAIYTRSTPPPNPYVIGDWTEIDQTDPTTRVYLTRLTAALAPAYTQATFEHHHGVIYEDGTRHICPALSLLGKYILVRLKDGASKDFIFTCQDEEDSIYGQYLDESFNMRRPGVTIYNAYDLSWFLERQSIDRALTVGGLIRLPINFNLDIKGGRSTEISGNRSIAKTGTAPNESYVFDDPGSEPWSALDALQYAKRFANSYLGLNLGLTGNSDLANITDIISGEGTLRQLINRIISADRGYHWHMDGQTITIDTFTDVAISDGDAISPSIVCPANSNISSLNISADADMDADVKISHVDNAHYSHIEVRGEPIRVMCTFEGQHTLQAGWESADEIAYNAADPEELDRPAYEHVYRRFTIIDGWNGYRIPVFAPADNCWPAWDVAEPAKIDEYSQQTLYLGNLTFLRTLPVKDEGGAYRKPFCIAKDSDGYFLVHKAGKSRKSAHLRLLDDAAGIYLEPPYPHLYGKGSYTGGSSDPPLYDWKSATEGLVLTVAYETVEPVRIFVPCDTAPASGMNQAKVITMKDHHYWWRAPNTVVGFDTDALITEAAAETLRDDTPALRRIANLAAVWYGKRRAKLSVPYKRAELLDYLGHYIDEASTTGGSVDPAGTVVSRIDYRWGKGEITATLRTDYRDIDLPSMVVNGNRRSSNTPKAAGSRVGADPDNMQAIDVSLAIGGGGEAKPISVSWDADAEDWTITVTGLRWTSERNPINPNDTSNTQGTFPNKTWVFSDNLDSSTPFATIHIGWIFPDPATVFPDVNANKVEVNKTSDGGGLRFAVEYPAGPDVGVEDDSTDKVKANGMFHRIAEIFLARGGTYSIVSDVQTPHITYTPFIGGDETHLHYREDNQTLYLIDIGRGDVDTGFESTFSPPSLVIPVGTEDIVQYGRIEGTLSPQVKLRGDSGVDWAEEYPLQLCKIKTDSTGLLEYLKPFTQRLHYRPIMPTRHAMGKIVAKISQNVYTVDIYEDGIYDDAGSTKAKTEVATQCFCHQISNYDTIPANTVVYLLRFDDHWEFQVPTWL